MLQTGAGSRLRSKIAALQAYGGLTFFKDYSLMPTGAVSATTLAADYSIGSAAATFTASRGASNPAMLLDHNGVVSSSVTSNLGRKVEGLYSTTGFVSRPGIIVEGASTNYLLTSYMDADGNADGLSDNWSTGSFGTNSRVAAPEVSSITNHYWQRTTHTFTDSEPDFSQIYYQRTAVGSFATNDWVTVSFTIKGTSSITSGKVFRVYASQHDAAGGWLASLASGATEISLANINYSTPVRLSFTGRATHASVSRINVEIGQISATTFTPASGDTCNIYITDFQIEKLPHATTFIPTTTAALTRNAETLTYPISGNRTEDTESIFVKTTRMVGGGTLNDFQYLIGSQTKNRAIFHRIGNTQFSPNDTDNPTCDPIGGGNGSAFESDVWVGVCQKGVSPYGAIYEDGVSAGTETSVDFTTPAWGTNFSVGYSVASNSRHLYGIIQSLAIFSDAKDASQVAAISALLAGA